MRAGRSMMNRLARVCQEPRAPAFAEASTFAKASVDTSADTPERKPFAQQRAPPRPDLL